RRSAVRRAQQPGDGGRERIRVSDRYDLAASVTKKFCHPSGVAGDRRYAMGKRLHERDWDAFGVRRQDHEVDQTCGEPLEELLGHDEAQETDDVLEPETVHLPLNLFLERPGAGEPDLHVEPLVDKPPRSFDERSMALFNVKARCSQEHSRRVELTRDAIRLGYIDAEVKEDPARLVAL